MSDNPFITKDGIEVIVGQVWRDCDPRSNGRTVRVKERGNITFLGKVRIVTLTPDGREWAPMRWLAVARMHKNPRGYEFVSA